jgi:outer membrane protein
MKATRSQMYPTLSAFGGLGSNFSNSLKEIKGTQIVGYTQVDPGGPVAVGPAGVFYPIVSPDVKFTQGSKSFGKIWNGYSTQLSNNFGQNIGLQLSIPIFNGGQANINYQKSKLNLQNAVVTREQIDQTLKQNIYQAYNSAVAALQKYNATQTTVAATEKAFDFATRRYNLGLLSTLDLITSQTNVTKAKLDLLTSHYDYVFKMKVLEFYKGQGIRLQ